MSATLIDVAEIWRLEQRIKYPTDKLLAFKPLLLNKAEMKLHPAMLPDWEWPATQVVTSPCPEHNEPVDGCTCGVYSSFDLRAMREFNAALIDQSEDIIPVLGVIQVLGQTVIEGLTLRSWGAFLWGLIKPSLWHNSESWLELMQSDVNDWYFRFNPVRYSTFNMAAMEIASTLKYHKLINLVDQEEDKRDANQAP